MRLRTIGIIPLLLMAFGLWVHNLDGMSLWRDEALSVHRAQQPLAQLVRNVNVITNVESPDLHPPSYFLFLNGWRKLVGESEFAYRLPSIFGMLLLVAVIGRQSPPAALILITTPFAHWYAREARMYAFVALGSAILLSLLLSKRSVLSLFITSLILISLHYASLFLVGAVGFIWLIQTLVSMNASMPNLPKANAKTVNLSSITLRKVLVVLGIGLIIILILTGSIPILTRNFAHFSTRPPHHLLWETFTTFMLGSAVPPNHNGLWFIPFMIVALIGIITEWRLGTLIALTILLAWLSSLIVPNYTNPRHLTVLFPVWMMALGVGIGRLGRIHWAMSLLATAILMTITTTSLSESIIIPPIVKDDVRGAIDTINQRALPNDVLIINAPMLEPLVAYYAPDIAWRTLPWWGQHDTAEMETVTAVHTAQFERVWTLNAVGNENGVTDWLDNNWAWGSELYFDGSWQTLRVRNYRPPVYFEQPPAPYLLQVDGAAVYTALPNNQPFVEGNGVWLNLIVVGSERIERNQMCVELVDAAGNVPTLACTPLGEMEIHTIQLWLPLPLGLLDGEHTLRVRLMDETADITNVTIEQTDDGRSPLTAIANHELLDVMWQANSFTEGQWAIGDLLLRAGDANDEKTPVSARLIDWLGRTTAEIPLTIPAHTAGDVVRTPLYLPLPFHQTGTRRLQLNIGGRWKTVSRTRITSLPKIDTLPSTAVLLTETVVWQNMMQLVGYELEQEQLHLYWQLANDPADLPYHVFIHIGTPSQLPNYQTSHVPAANTRPIASWRTGELIKDTHPIPLNYDGVLQVGWFDPADVNVRSPLTVDAVRDKDDIFEIK